VRIVGASRRWAELDLRTRFVDVGDVNLHVVEAGEGPLTILLHGFPEFWYGWRNQMPALVEAGRRVVVPDQRGYGLSDKPSNWRQYALEALVGDVVALIAACGERRATLVGHGFGGHVAWHVAMLYPERVDRLAVLAAPHPERLRDVPDRRRRGRTMRLLEQPMPALTAATEIRRVALELLHDAGPDVFSDEDMRRYRAAWAQPGAAKAMLDWFRAFTRRTPGSRVSLWRPVDSPVLSLWGEDDRCQSVELSHPDPHWVPHAHVVTLPDVGHWLQHQDPAAVNDVLVDFLA
jgi:pimeloyl-ACP methyl ester carboxylesterase